MPNDCYFLKEILNCSSDKETDESWDIFIHNMKNQFWAGLEAGPVL